jgi:molecular chaperone DnaK
MAADNKLLGEFNLIGIPPAPRGTPQIEVTFDIDANGIVNVSAKDKGTGKEQQIRIQASGGLSEAEIEKMVKDAEAHAEEDKRLRALVEARNQAESLIHATETSLAENGEKLGPSDRTAIENALSALRSAAAGEDTSQIEGRSGALSQAATKLAEAAAQPARPRGGDTTSATTRGTGDDEVVDAEFEEVDPQKRGRQ